MNASEPNGTLRYRLDRIEERVSALERAEINVIADRVERGEEVVKDFRAQVRGEVADVKRLVREQNAETAKLVREENQTTRRALLGFILTIAGGVSVLALTFNFA